MLIAIVRTNLFDVDRLITGTAVYSVLSVLVLAAVLTAVPQLARPPAAPPTSTRARCSSRSSVARGRRIVPGYRLLQPAHRARPVPRTPRAARRRRGAAARPRGGRRPRGSLTLVGERLDALLRPQTCVIYAPLGDCFAPVFARGAERRRTADVAGGRRR